MTYVILIIAGLIGVYGLYRFFLNASAQQIAAAFRVTALMVFAAALLFLSLTGRLPAAIALFAAVSPFVIAWWRKRNSQNIKDVKGEVIDDDDDNNENNKDS